MNSRAISTAVLLGITSTFAVGQAATSSSVTGQGGDGQNDCHMEEQYDASSGRRPCDQTR